MTTGSYEALFQGTQSFILMKPHRAIEAWAARFSPEASTHQGRERIDPRGLSRKMAAAYINVGTKLFDALVKTGQMPEPKSIGRKRLWDRVELDAAFDVLGSRTLAQPSSWDVVLR
jgi:hypothetical protein